MQRDRLSILVLALCGAVTACQQPPKATAPTAAPSPAPASDDTVAADAQAHAEALRETLAQQQAVKPAAAPRITWIDPAESAAKAEALRKLESPTPAPQPAAPAKPTTTDAYGILLDHLQHNDQLTPMGKAAAAVTLTAAVPDQRFDDSAALASLRGYERDVVERYRAVLAALRDKVAAGSSLDRVTVLDELEAMFEHAPIRIRDLKLCQRVRGFGSYDEADASTLLAGREHRMIAYVELDDYRALPGEGPDGQYEVKLSQEIELFNEADGLAVWHVEPVQIVDHCRNKRRDFFIVQLIKLPPRLTVGKYLLKIRVSDQHGGSVDERTIPVAVVADAAMVGK